MTNDQSERVLTLTDVEGSVELIRHWNEHRAWRFIYKIQGRGVTNPALDFGRASQDPDHPHDFLTLGDAIHACSPGGEWVSWSVLDVHPDYRLQVWEVREQVIETADEGRQKIARRHDSQWSKACGRPLSRNHIENSEQLSENPIAPGSALDLILGASIAVIEHLHKAPMSAEEISEFETAMIRVIQKRNADRLGHS